MEIPRYGNSVVVSGRRCVRNVPLSFLVALLYCCIVGVCIFYGCSWVEAVQRKNREKGGATKIMAV